MLSVPEKTKAGREEKTEKFPLHAKTHIFLNSLGCKKGGNIIWSRRALLDAKECTRKEVDAEHRNEQQADDFEDGRPKIDHSIVLYDPAAKNGL